MRNYVPFAEADEEIAEDGTSIVEPGQFSAIDVLYCDGANYKQLESYVVEGELSFSQLKPYLENGVYFIGQDVGMEDLCFSMRTIVPGRKFKG